MSSDYDATEFIDHDFQPHQSLASAAQFQRAPTREEVDSKVAEAQQKLTELRRTQEELERQRGALEETRRRQIEFQTGRQEALQSLTRGLGLLEEAEFSARRDAEQMAKTMADLRDALAKVEALHQESWTQLNFEGELTRALTTLENARMEWNSARLKFPLLSGQTPESKAEATVSAPVPSLVGSHSFGELCRLGLALTWPLAVVAILTAAALCVLLLRH